VTGAMAAGTTAIKQDREGRALCAPSAGLNKAKPASEPSKDKKRRHLRLHSRRQVPDVLPVPRDEVNN